MTLLVPAGQTFALHVNGGQGPLEVSASNPDSVTISATADGVTFEVTPHWGAFVLAAADGTTSGWLEDMQVIDDAPPVGDQTITLSSSPVAAEPVLAEPSVDGGSAESQP